MTLCSSLWRLIKLASDVSTVGGGLLFPLTQICFRYLSEVSFATRLRMLHT
jgi:hypothetical protein